MRGRSGIVFVVLFAVGLVIFYISWRSLISPDVTPKDNLSPQMNLGISSKDLKIGDRAFVMNNNRENQQVNRGFDNKLQQDIFSNKELLHQGNPHNSRYDILPSENDEKQSLENNMFRKKEKGVPEGNYRTFDEIKSPVSSMKRLVHLDLKGAAPKMNYLLDLIPVLSKLGATGLLVEYEDMFPYSGMLSNISALNSYTVKEIKDFLEKANSYKMEVIPLIQTFGHMEFVLKSVFKDLRETKSTPQVIDVTSERSYKVIGEMVKQILAAHPSTSYLHIGCDEAYEFGRGASSTYLISKGLSKHEMMINHLVKVAEIVKKFGDQKVVPIIWDDMIREVSSESIKKAELPSLVEIMVWNYGDNVFDRVNMTIWKKYASLFKNVWIASAFKGASGSRQFFAEPQYYLKNHFSWLEVISALTPEMRFKGMALTGWSRYDHFATLCELLPVSIPSLAVCLQTMQNAGFTPDIHSNASKIIQCDSLIEMGVPKIDKHTKLPKITQSCRFPGHELYHSVQELYAYTEMSQKHRIDGWLSDYQLAHNFSNPGQLTVMSMGLNKQRNFYLQVSVPLKFYLSKYFADDVVDEWMDENVEERKRYIDELQKKIQRLLVPNVWSRHPLPRVQIALPFDNGLSKFGSKQKSSINGFEKQRNAQMETQSLNFSEKREKVKLINADERLKENEVTRTEDKYSLVKNDTRYLGRKSRRFPAKQNISANNFQDISTPSQPVYSKYKDIIQPKLDEDIPRSKDKTGKPYKKRKEIKGYSGSIQNERRAKMNNIPAQKVRGAAVSSDALKEVEEASKLSN
ncbi:hexosaminidase D-like [Physella acuta]|uniref:hexosaminidase D-like n=1 Tax=Physella acuta TaxID=109671 RepID=UPI0027DE43C8|nr:hexosaminidase D-like [Physella acuta]